MAVNSRSKTHSDVRELPSPVCQELRGWGDHIAREAGELFITSILGACMEPSAGTQRTLHISEVINPTFVVCCLELATPGD